MPVTYSSADAIADIPGASYSDLIARFKSLAAVVSSVGAERKALYDEIAAREKEVAIKLRLGSLSDDDKILYREILNSPSFSRG